MKKNKKILYLLIIFAIIIILIGVIILFLNNKSTNKVEIKNYDNFELNQNKILNICNSANDCSNNIVYDEIKYKGSIKAVKNIINNLNSELSEEYAKNEIYSKEDSCAIKGNDIYYTYYELYLYENENYVSITIGKTKQYYCIGKKEQEPLTETYFYSKEDNKLLTTKEIRKALDITDYRLKYSIESNIVSLNAGENINYTYENTFQNGKQDIKIFYDGNGRVLIHYISNEDNQYHIAELLKGDK